MSTFSSDREIPFRTIVEAFHAANPEREFVTMWHDEDDFETITFGEFGRRAAAQARLMAEYGVGTSDTVVLVMPQGVALMAAFAGAMWIGAVPAILAYPNFKLDPVKYRAGLAGVTANLAARLIIVDDDFPGELLNFLGTGGGARLVRAVAARAASKDIAPARSVRPENIAFIQHSAGTTGLQKGVALTHGAVMRQLGHLTRALGVNSDDRIYSWLPLYHDMGLIACFMLPMTYHLPVAMQSPEKWVLQPRTMLELVSRYRSTLAWLPNFAFQFLARRVQEQDRAGLDLSSLRALINCSEPVKARSMDDFLAAYASHGFRAAALHSSYAIAENVFAITQSELASPSGPQRLWVDGEALRKLQVARPAEPGTAGTLCLVASGRCLPGNRLRIVSAGGKDLPAGHVGEIIICSDSLFEGYYNRPAQSAEVLHDGWYWTGDLGFILAEQLYVIGRKHDLIIVAGKNIHPQDVEEIIGAHPNVRDGRVIALGLYNPSLGTEDIVAVAEVREPADLARSSAIERAAKSLVMAELGVALRALYLKAAPWIVKSSAGKPARSTTRERLLAEHPELAGGPDAS